MIPMLVFSGIILVAALVINRMLSGWHNQSLKALKKEEMSLRVRLDKVGNEQKKALVKLRRLKNQVVTYERMVDDRQMKNGE
ncbi:hypothetical protein [Desulfovibrio sp. JC010]|uniref:hypothetical protein n=1 Tax=Desulfovibrio sp. JC010 TaxID=2593641 RepID=UPI0013D16C9B|nr:hypothetical protein [Desulfovibrio sp. JC010]NDV28422.1 hypothetical protein [Desulfovibrio sp. JC010]